MNDLNIKAYGTNNKSNTTIPYTYSVTHKETEIGRASCRERV